jgi:release factor glutamine methyltransferase
VPAATPRTLRGEVTARLRRAGIPGDEARLDAELLVREALGRWDRARMIAHDTDPAPQEVATRLEALAARRAAREPMAYVLGRAEFWGLEFETGPGVLVPRPETELIVERVRGLFEGTAGPRHVADVGTGSGCLAVALAHMFPSTRLTATDISPAAIEVARRNARRHGVEPRITFRERAFTGQAGGCDLIVSNPPYVPEGDRAMLQPEVRDHEPPAALFAGADGLDVIRALVPLAWNALDEAGGWLVFEFGAGQAEAVRALLAGDRWAEVTIAPDLQGIPRVACARKRVA